MRYGILVFVGCLLLLFSAETGHTNPLDRKHWEGLPLELKTFYVAGVFDAWMVARAFEDGQVEAEGRAARFPSRIRRVPDITRCVIGKGIGVSEGVALVDKYLADHPEERNLPKVMSLYVLDVLEVPCAK